MNQLKSVFGNMKYEHFSYNFIGLEIEVKLLDDSAYFPNEDKKDMVEEFKVIIKHGEKKTDFKFYNSIMERKISQYLKELGYVKYNNALFKSWMRRFHWDGYDKIKNREDLIKKRIYYLFSSILGSVACDYNTDLSSFKEFCGNFGYDEDSRRAKKIYNLCQEQQEKLRSLNLNEEQLTYLNDEVGHETEAFDKTIKELVGVKHD